MKRVVVTGGSGFIGTHTLPALLRRGFEVHALGRSRPKIPGVIFHKVDLFDTHGLATSLASVRASHLLHLAWDTTPELYWTSPQNLNWAAASIILVRLFQEAGGERVVAAGSCAEYRLDRPQFREDDPCEPSTFYGIAKDATRRLISGFAAETGLSFSWARLFYLYGPGERTGRLVSDAIQALQLGERFAASSGEYRRDFSYVEDVGTAFAAILDTKVTGAINIGSGEALSIRTILENLGRLSGRYDLIDVGARKTKMVEPLCIEADVTRLRNEICFLSQNSLEDGLMKTWKSIQTKKKIT